MYQYSMSSIVCDVLYFWFVFVLLSFFVPIVLHDLCCGIHRMNQGKTCHYTSNIAINSCLEMPIRSLSTLSTTYIIASVLE